MGVTKTIVEEGTGPSPHLGQTVVMEYTGFLKDTNKPGNRGTQFDTSKNRGHFVTPIGVRRVIKGWGEGVPQMKVGETAVLDITAGYAYGAKGFGPIPGGADLIFEVKLVEIR